MQGVVRTFVPLTREGVIMGDVDRADYALAADALERSIFRMLRQGQRVNFEVDGSGFATNVRIGAEIDMGLPAADV
jgi:CspA family cold shock protein